MKPIRILACLALLSGASAGPARASDTDAFAFVVQQVCVDAADHAVAGDPAACPRRRTLRVGEPIPYRRVDIGNWQALFSYPVRGPDGEVRAVAAKVAGGNDESNGFGDLGVRSGFDLLQVGPDYVSAIRTSDPGGGDQIMWRNIFCERTNGWILFPPGLQPGQHGEVRSTLKITKGPSIACPYTKLLSIGPDDTVWDRPTDPYRYTSGKALDTITSEHFAYGDPANPAHDNDSMEKFFFTREYGFTRWEAWETPEGCRKRALHEGRSVDDTCRPSPLTICNGPNSTSFFGKVYTRLDCHDSTVTVTPLDKPFNPPVSDVAPGDIVSRNLLLNATFADGLSGWQAIGDTRATVEREQPERNRVARLVCGPDRRGGLAQSFTIPATLLDKARVLRWGLAIKAATDADATLVLTLARRGPGPQEVTRPIATKAGGWTSVAFTLPEALPPGDSIEARLEIRCGSPGEVTIDDAFAALLDRPDATLP